MDIAVPGHCRTTGRWLRLEAAERYCLNMTCILPMAWIVVQHCEQFACRRCTNHSEPSIIRSAALSATPYSTACRCAPIIAYELRPLIVAGSVTTSPATIVHSRSTSKNAASLEVEGSVVEGFLRLCEVVLIIICWQGPSGGWRQHGWIASRIWTCLNERNRAI